MMNTKRLFVLLVVVFSIGGTNLAAGGNRDATIDVLSGIRHSWHGADFKTWLNSIDTENVRVGDFLVFHFESNKDCFVNIFHVDSHGVSTILRPKTSKMGNHIGAGTKHTYPAMGDDLALKAEPPLGKEDMFVVCTPEPLDQAGLGVPDDFAIYEDFDAPARAKNFKRVLGDGPVAMARLEYRVLGRDESRDYTTRDIVNYFTKRTRSISRPKLDLHIKFDYDSAVLTGPAKESLMGFGEALQNEPLRDKVFTLGGHTDAIGSDEYNKNLSERRAASVREFLRGQYNIEPERLQIKGFGEAQPLESNDTAEGRAMNRRVQFEMTP